MSPKTAEHTQNLYLLSQILCNQNQRRSLAIQRGIFKTSVQWIQEEASFDPTHCALLVINKHRVEGVSGLWSITKNQLFSLRILPRNCVVRGHCMCKEMPVIPVDRVVEQGIADPPPPKKKTQSKSIGTDTAIWFQLKGWDKSGMKYIIGTCTYVYMKGCMDVWLYLCL
jgi:hypothetical protein